MATDTGALQPRARFGPVSRVSLPAWPGPAWGAIGVTALFIAITSWWLTQDRTVPIFDAGLHLIIAIQVHHELSAGNLGNALTLSVPYPPFAYLIGSLGMLIGGVSVTAPILAQNLIFVPLLALGCYKVGRMAFGATAGLLAVVFALGSPLITAQFHVFMTDAPETAMVAVSVWLIISTEGFSHVGRCAVAGVAVGLGMVTKEPFSAFVVGIVGVTLWRGGRQSWRGFVVFGVVALVIAAPWYLSELKEIQNIGGEASSSSATFAQYRIPDVAPPRFSPTNLEWYVWSMINSQLYLPLFLFAAVGWGWTMVEFARRRLISPLAPELAIGAFCAWAIITETFIHDERYSMPLLIYLAIFGAGWVVKLRGRWRVAATSVLVLIAVANTLGTTFSVGNELKVELPGATANTLQGPGILTIYEDGGFLVSGPRRDGDLLGMFQALHRGGVRGVFAPREDTTGADFSEAGVVALMMIAGLEHLSGISSPTQLTKRDAVVFHAAPSSRYGPACVTLDDGTGVWLVLGNPDVPGAEEYCPLPKPHFYN
jgi:hypothetical protein